jgi:putative membrane protein
MRVFQKILLAGAAATLLTCASVAVAGEENARHKGPLTADAFVTKAAQTGMAEVELGKLALAKSQSSEVRAFAARMVKDHRKANEELAGIAKGKNIVVPAALDAKHRAMVDGLEARSGAEFDAEYARHMAMGHGDAVALFKDASRAQTLDHELSAFAKTTLPTLEEHKRMADQLAASRTAAARSEPQPVKQ